MLKTLCILSFIVFFSPGVTFSQFISEISGGIGTNGLSASITHQLNKKLVFGETLSYMDWKPSLYASPFNRQGLAIMRLNFWQTGLFFRWHPKGEEHMYGYQKTGLYLIGGMNYKFNDDWLTTSAYYAKRKVEDPLLNTEFYQMGEIILHTFTNKLQPFTGIGYSLLGNDSKVTLQLEGGISFHGKPSGYVSSRGEIDIQEVDRRRLLQLHTNLFGFPFFQLHIGYNYYDINNDAFPSKF